MFDRTPRALAVLLALLLMTAACSDSDESNDDPNPEPTMAPEPDPMPGMDPEPTPTPDADPDPTPDANPGPPCEPAIAMEVDEADYDAYLLPPFEELVNELTYVAATVRKNGQDVVVVVDEDEIPAVFEESEELGHCVANPDVQVLKLCFFNADGTPAEPGALGAVFRPLGAALFGVVAHRRGIERPCTAQGHYNVTVEASNTEGDNDVSRFAAEQLLSYISLFDVEGDTTIFMGELPRPIEVDFDPATGEFSGVLEDDTLLFEEVDDTVVEWEIEMAVSGSFLRSDTANAGVEAEVTLTITGDNIDDTVLTATLVGPRL